MALTKEDLTQIGEVVDKRISESEKRLSKKIDDKIGQSEKNLSKKIETEVGLSEKRLSEKIESEVEGLAIITKRGFDNIDKKFEEVDKKIDKALIAIANLDFIATEMVRRDELLEVKQRLSRIESKIGIK